MRYKEISNNSYWVTPSPTVGSSSGDGPEHATHMYAISEYVSPGSSLLDIGCGNAWTYQAVKAADMEIRFKGVDVLPAQIEYNRKMFPEAEWGYQDGSFLAEEDASWDVSLSRGVIDYMPTFEIGLKEHLRVSRDLAIIWFWWGLIESDEHQYSRIVTGDILHRDYGNKYSEKKVLETISEQKGWEVLRRPIEAIKGVPEQIRLLVMKKLPMLMTFTVDFEWGFVERMPI